MSVNCAAALVNFMSSLRKEGTAVLVAFIDTILSFIHRSLTHKTLTDLFQIESLSTVSEYLSGVAQCPYNPYSNVTAVIADSGEYYVGTPTDFSSSDFAIARFVYKNSLKYYLA